MADTAGEDHDSEDSYSRRDPFTGPYVNAQQPATTSANAAPPASDPRTQADWQFRSVVAGHLIELVNSRRSVVVRIEGVIAPLPGEENAGRSRTALAQLVNNKRITFRGTSRDEDGRVSARVILPDGRDAGVEMVRSGYARIARSEEATDELVRLERTARERGLGLWADSQFSSASTNESSIDIGRGTSREATHRFPHGVNRSSQESVRISRPAYHSDPNRYASPEYRQASPSRVAENGSYYGQPNQNGVPKTVRVRGYYRADGTYVRGHYRSPPNSN
ncbi:thermonuclease family protein [Phycisphaerales bacterium AB-hyl4]|uniref:Thermonuclease family protein n=1 Tax=Natronomicrosphaera hydrolytica TaxID=3242702 RepID=A0ABV4UA23_9BACT